MSDRRVQYTRNNDQLIHVLAHDMQAPARALRQYIVLLNDALGDQPAPNAERFLSRMGQVLDRMDARLDALVLLSRFDRARGEVAAQDLSALLERAAYEHNVVATIADTPLVIADKIRMKWLVNELIMNIKHHAGEGARVQFEHDGELFWVRDDGAGIPAHQRQEAFLIFRPVPHPNTSREGVGLSACGRIVSSLGGQMGLVCPEGGGTHVHFCLPLAQDDC